LGRYNPERHAEYMAKEENRLRKRALARISHYRRAYGLSPEEAEEVLSQPCGVCGERPSTVIDHDHETGRVRGGVCKWCNSLLPLLDTPGLLEKAQAFVSATYHSYGKMGGRT
jgi:hypothetical protein